MSQVWLRILGLQCNSWQHPLFQNLENCHSEGLEDSLSICSLNYGLLRKMNNRWQTVDLTQ